MNDDAIPPARSRFIPTIVNDELAKFVGDPTFDHAQWAAFTLGYHTQMMPLYLAAARTAPYLGPLALAAFDAVPLAVYELTLACNSLLTVVPPSVRIALDRVLSELEVNNDTMACVFHGSGELAADEGRERQLGDCLITLANQAIPTSSPLAGWNRVGRELGKFRWLAQKEESWALAPLRPVAEAARTLTDEEREGLPELTEIGNLIDLPESTTEAGLRKLFVERVGLNGTTFDDMDPWLASPFMIFRLEEITQKVSEHLQTLPRQTTAQGPSVIEPPMHPRKPKWHRAAGHVFHKGNLVRTVAGQATNLHVLLDCFEHQGWPASIESPFQFTDSTGSLHYDVDARKDAIRRFNKKSTGLKLFAAAGTEIGWREV